MSSSTFTSSNKRKRVPKCSNCFIENPTHNYQDCKEPCYLCKKNEHKTRSCPFYRIKNRNKKHMPNPSDNEATTSNASKNNNDSDSGNRELMETENVLAENGVFALAAMTSAATFPTNFKSIEVQRYQIKFKTVNGSEGTIKLHTDENEVRNVREEFQNVNINYVNRNHSTSEGDIEYSIRLNEKSVPRGGLDKIKRIGKFLSQAKYYKDVMPAKIPLRQTDISPADWRVEKYVLWERQKSVAINEIESEEDQSGSFSGSIFDDPPNVIAVVRNWKKAKNTKTTYFRNPPKISELNEDVNIGSFLSDYIEYLSEGLKFIQYSSEVNRRSELRYCSYLDEAVEIYRRHVSGDSDIIKTFFSENPDNKDRVYLSKKKMVGKRLNKIIAQCQLNWNVIDCVEELSVNFLTNVVQEENLNVLIDEINQEYTPKFSKRGVNELIQGAKTRLAEIKQLNLNEVCAHLSTLKEKVELEDYQDNLKTMFNGFEYDIIEDEDSCESLDLNEKEKELFNNVIEERRELLSRLEVIIENITTKLTKL